MTAKGVTSEPVILLIISSRMMTCGLPWPMPWTTSLEIARTAIFSKFSNATESRWHFLTTILWPFDDYPLMVKKIYPQQSG